MFFWSSFWWPETVQQSKLSTVNFPENLMAAVKHQAAIVP